MPGQLLNVSRLSSMFPHHRQKLGNRVCTLWSFVFDREFGLVRWDSRVRKSIQARCSVENRGAQICILGGINTCAKVKDTSGFLLTYPATLSVINAIRYLRLGA